jgi:hypothetical protein
MPSTPPTSLPNREQAVIPPRKITDYLLSRLHPDGAAKAIFFLRFGFTPDAWGVLADALRQHAEENEVVETQQTLYGTLYVVEGPLHAPDGRTPRVRVVWFIGTGETAPRLATAYPLKEVKP